MSVARKYEYLEHRESLGSGLLFLRDPTEQPSLSPLHLKTETDLVSKTMFSLVI
jgi:hypothetical protein